MGADVRRGKCCCGDCEPPTAYNSRYGWVSAINQIGVIQLTSLSPKEYTTHDHYTGRNSVDELAVGDRTANYAYGAWIANSPTTGWRQWVAYPAFSGTYNVRHTIKYLHKYADNKMIVQAGYYYAGYYYYKWYAVSYRSDASTFTVVTDSLTNTMFGAGDIESHFSAVDAQPESTTIKEFSWLADIRPIWTSFSHSGSSENPAWVGDGINDLIDDLDANGWPWCN